MNTSQYISRLNTLYHTGAATEHSYRGDLQQLLMDLLPEILVTNEPSRVSCGAPDYVLTRKEVPEYSAFMTDRPSETMVPDPTIVR